MGPPLLGDLLKNEIEGQELGELLRKFSKTAGNPFKNGRIKRNVNIDAKSLIASHKINQVKMMA